ncbi:MAG: mechanosensitive ion channel, partial [Spirochaetales bacterium]|nr:mechanosensitive ion channel [Spirochaetales bacterium]
IPLENKYTLKKPAPIARFESFGDSGLNLCLYTWLKDPAYKLDVNDWINREIWRRFKEEGLTIPFPHVQIINPQKAE